MAWRSPPSLGRWHRRGGSSGGSPVEPPAKEGSLEYVTKESIQVGVRTISLGSSFHYSVTLKVKFFLVFK